MSFNERVTAGVQGVSFISLNLVFSPLEKIYVGTKRFGKILRFVYFFATRLFPFNVIALIIITYSSFRVVIGEKCFPDILLYRVLIFKWLDRKKLC